MRAMSSAKCPLRSGKYTPLGSTRWSPALDERGEEVDERHALAVDAHRDREVEPVPVGRAHRVEGEDGRLLGGPVPGQLAGHLDARRPRGPRARAARSRRTGRRPSPARRADVRQAGVRRQVAGPRAGRQDAVRQHAHGRRRRRPPRPRCPAGRPGRGPRPSAPRGRSRRAASRAPAGGSAPSGAGRRADARTSRRPGTRGRYSEVNLPTSGAGTCTGRNCRTAVRCGTSAGGTGATCSTRTVFLPRCSCTHHARAPSSPSGTARDGTRPCGADGSPATSPHVTSSPSSTARTSSCAVTGSWTTASPGGRPCATKGSPASRSSHSRSQTRRLSISVRSSHAFDCEDQWSLRDSASSSVSSRRWRRVRGRSPRWVYPTDDHAVPDTCQPPEARGTTGRARNVAGRSASSVHEVELQPRLEERPAYLLPAPPSGVLVGRGGGGSSAPNARVQSSVTVPPAARPPRRRPGPAPTLGDAGQARRRTAGSALRRPAGPPGAARR